MKLIVTCENCREVIKLKNSVNDRGELSREIGDEFNLNCKECLTKSKYHVNDVKAKESKGIALIALMIFVFGTISISYLLKDFLLMPMNPYSVLSIGGIILIPTVIFIILKNQERENVRRFNGYWS